MNTLSCRAILRHTMKADDFKDFKNALEEAKANMASSSASFNESIRQAYTAKRNQRKAISASIFSREDMLKQRQLAELLQGMRVPV